MYGQVNDLDNVRVVQQRITEAGHHITHDWTHNETGDKLLNGQKAKFENPEEAARRADADMQGVIDSDVYILCSDNENVGKGMYVELGAAIALNATTGSPRIYIVGEMNHSSIFYWHPSVILGRTVDEILEEMK